MTHRLSLLFTAAFVIALAGMPPLKLALDGAGSMGLGAAMVSGSVWNGRIDYAVFRGTSLGTLQARLDPVGLLTGVARVRLESERGRANVVRGRHHGFDGASLEIDAKELGLFLTGRVILEDAGIIFGGETCVEAKGRIRTEMLRESFGGPELEGGLVCAGNDAVVELSGANDAFQVAMTVKIQSGGQYRAETVVTGAAANQQSALALAGFSRNGDMLRRVDEGRLMR